MKMKLMMVVSMVVAAGAATTIMAESGAIVEAANQGSLRKHQDKRNKKRSIFKQQHHKSSEKNIARSGVLAGRDYYSTLVEDALQYHWAMPFSVHFNFTHDSFDNKGQVRPLFNGVFGVDEAIKFRDIYLLSRLSDDRKVHSESRTLAGVAANTNFPELPEHQWPGLLAKTKVLLRGLEQRDLIFNANAMYRWSFGCDDSLEAAIGITLPIKYRQRSMNLGLIDGSIITKSEVSTIGGSVFQQNALVEFFNDFSSVEDFFLRGILEPKGLTFDPFQRKAGFGDVSLFGFVDFAGKYEALDSFQLGMNAVFPSGSKSTGKKLWELELGTGLYRVEFFTQMMFSTCLSFFNPLFRAAVGVHPTSTVTRRLPVVRRFTHQEPHDTLQLDAEKLSQVPFLIVPPTYGGSIARYTDTFEEVDSLVPEFADHAYRVGLKKGSDILLTAGNYCYQLFNIDLRLGVFYDYYAKGHDCYNVGKCAGPFAPADAADFVLQDIIDRSAVRAHNIGWNLSYKFCNDFELGMGSHHTIAGRNIAKNHEAFITFVAVF